MTSSTFPNPPTGSLVHLDFRKYDGREHWQEDYRLLGVDEDGIWLGMPAGTPFARPGRHVLAKTDTVRLVRPGARWAACFNAPGGDQRIGIYVDITTPVSWQVRDETVTGTLVDVDLDVVCPFEGEPYTDDEDEFLAHQRELAYPASLVSASQAAAELVYADVVARRPPYDGRAEAWSEKLAASR